MNEFSRSQLSHVHFKSVSRVLTTGYTTSLIDCNLLSNGMIRSYRISTESASRGPSAIAELLVKLLR